MDRVLIGKITSPVGLKGEVKVWNYSDRTQIYEETEEFFVGEKRRKLESLRRQKNMLIIKFQGIDSREEAEESRNLEIFVLESDLPPLEEGEFYIRDIVGMAVQDEEGNPVGAVKEVVQNTAQNLLQVERPQGSDVLIPWVDAYVLRIDPDIRSITVHIQEGLMDL